MNIEPILHVVLTLSEAQRVIRLVAKHGTPEDMDIIRAIDCALEEPPHL